MSASSCTSSSERQMFRVYVTVLSIGFVALIAALLLNSRVLEPFTGDLTRIGGLSEADYGWTLPQLRFDQPQYVYTTQLPLPAGPWDVVVFGDSFTDPDRPSAPWLDFVASRSGWRTVAVRYRSVEQIESYLDSTAFRQRPPRLVIVESVTRNMAYRLAQGDCVSQQSAESAHPARVDAASVAPAAVAREHARRTDFADTLERLNVSSYLVRQKLMYSVLPRTSPVRSYSLERIATYRGRPRQNRVHELLTDQVGRDVQALQRVREVRTSRVLACNRSRSDARRIHPGGMRGLRTLLRHAVALRKTVSHVARNRLDDDTPRRPLSKGRRIEIALDLLDRAIAHGNRPPAGSRRHEVEPRRARPIGIREAVAEHDHVPGARRQ